MGWLTFKNCPCKFLAYVLIKHFLEQVVTIVDKRQTMYLYLSLNGKWVHRHTLNHFSKEICLNGFTMQSYGFPEGLQISLYRWASFRWSSSARGHYSQSWGSSRVSWWRNFPTQEADQIFSTNSSSALFNPSQHILIASLIANLNSNIKTSLMGIHAFC